MFQAVQPAHDPPPSPYPLQSHSLPEQRDQSPLSMQNLEDKTLPPLSHAIPSQFRPSSARTPPGAFDDRLRDIREYNRPTSAQSPYAQPFKYERQHSFPPMETVTSSTRPELAPVRVNTFHSSNPYPSSEPTSATAPRQAIPAHGTNGIPHGHLERQREPVSAESSCKACINSRPIIQKIISALLVLDIEIYGSGMDADASVSYPPRAPEVVRDGSVKALQWTLDNIQGNVRRWKEGQDKRGSNPADGTYAASSAATYVKRKYSPSELDEGGAAKRSRSGMAHEMPPHFDDGSKSQYAAEHSHSPYSPHRTASSSGSGIMPLPSPRLRMLPSPSSTHFSTTQIAPQLPPVNTNIQNSAQAAHLQELQHQVTIKTLALQTLQREYDSLIQKLERQRTKCAALEKKFEVSDAEINSLTDERERVLLQVGSLEAQIDQLQQSRDEARKQSVANKGQYMKIIESASRLQAQGAADKRKWDAEKKDLEAKIASLKGDALVGISKGPASGKDPANEPSRPVIEDKPEAAVDTTTNSGDQIDADPSAKSASKPAAAQPTKASVAAPPTPAELPSPPIHISVPKAMSDDFETLILESNALQAMGSCLSRKGATMQILLEKLIHGTNGADGRREPLPPQKAADSAATGSKTSD